MVRIREIHATFVDVDGIPLEQYFEDFKKSVNVERELKTWEQMAKAYQRFSERRKLSQVQKREAFTLLLLRTTCSSKEAIEKAALKELTADQAREVLKGF